MNSEDEFSWKIYATLGVGLVLFGAVYWEIIRETEPKPVTGPPSAFEN